MTFKDLATKPRSGQNAKKHERLSNKRERKVRVDPSKNPTYVINRILDKGNLEGARFVPDPGIKPTPARGHRVL